MEVLVKMKIFISTLGGLLLLAGAAKAGQIKPLGLWPFSAPAVSSPDVIETPTHGDIVYDTTAKTFKGFTHANWQDFLNTASASFNLTDIDNGDSPYTVLTDDGLILVDANAGSVTINLPQISTVPLGKVYRVKRTDSNLSYTVTLDGYSTENIESSGTYALYTLGETVEIVNDNTKWRVIGHNSESGWLSYTPTISGFGSVTSVDFKYRRIGDSVEVMGAWKGGTNAASSPTISLPGGRSIDSSKILSVTMRSFVGVLYGMVTTTAINTPVTSRGPWWVSVLTSDLTTVFLGNDLDMDDSATDSLFRNQTAVAAFPTNSLGYAVRFTVPISGWQN
jgi:hypothetical protein